MNIKKVVITLCIAVACGAVAAQSELTGGIGGGVSMLWYKPSAGVLKLGYGGTAGIGYSYFFSDNWGIGIGFNASLYNSPYSNAALSDHYNAIYNNESFEFRYKFTDYQETQQAYMIMLPVMLHFQTGLFYMSAGAKIGVPFYTRYTAQASALDALGYFPKDELWLGVDPQQPTKREGFGNYKNIKGTGKMTLENSVFASLEFGLKWSIGSVVLYTGLYFDYGISNVYIEPLTDMRVVNYDNKNDYSINNYRSNGIFSSQVAGKPIVETINPLAAGVKLSFVLYGSERSLGGSSSASGSKGTRQVSSGAAANSGGMREQRQPSGEMSSTLQIRPYGSSDVCLQIIGAERKYDNIMVERSKKSYINNFQLSEATTSYLNDKIEIMRLHPNTKAIILGQNCCMCNGPITPNVEIGRIQAAKKYLVINGIRSDRITIKVQNTANFVDDPTLNDGEQAVKVPYAARKKTEDTAASKTNSRTIPRPPRPVRKTQQETETITTQVEQTHSSPAVRPPRRQRNEKPLPSIGDGIIQRTEPRSEDELDSNSVKNDS
jgi:hypothetical protein